MIYNPFSQQSHQVFSVCVLTLSLFLFGCNFQDSRQDGNSSGVYASLNDSTHYVGMQTCRQCHSKIYDSYIETGMGMSFGHASRNKSSAHFDHRSIVEDTFTGYNYFPHWIGDSLYVLEFLTNGLDTSYKRKELVSYIVGSGQHTNSHIRDVNGYLFQVPVTYYTQERKWDLPPGFEGGFNSRFNRKIELECMSCHNAMPELVAGSENKYLTIPNGIDCERCHGPGSRHLAEKSAGIFVDTSKYIDYSIVNPSKLPVALQMDVCQRCHIQGNAVLNEGKSFRDFRPGMALSSVMNVFMPLYKGDEDSHIMASHAERLKMSKCFLVSAKNIQGTEEKDALRPYKNALTCISCHNPHVSVRQTGQEVFNQKCNSCHSTKNKVEAGTKTPDPGSCSEAESKRALKKNNCIACHMPKNGSIDIPHVVTTDHFIRKPVPATEVDQIREFIGLACINNSQVDSIIRAKAFISYFEKFSSNPAFLDSAQRLISNNSKESIRKNYRTLVHLAFLQESYPKVISYSEELYGVNGFKGRVTDDNRDAWTEYRVGQSYLILGDLKKAAIKFGASVDLAPYQPDFRNKLASVQHDLGMIKEAVDNYKFLNREHPDFVPAYTNYGYLMLSEFSNVEAADRLYDKALALDPLNEQAQLNKAGILLFQEKYADARIAIKKLLQLYPDNVQASQLYQRLNMQKR
jgi:hypothetical protein